MSGKYIITSLSSRIIYIILAVFSVLFRIYHPGTLSYIFILVSVLYIVGFEIYARITKKNVRKTLKNTVAAMNLRTVNRLGAFPLPVVICDDGGNILWYSEKFVDFAGEPLVAKLNNIKIIQLENQQKT